MNDQARSYVLSMRAPSSTSAGLGCSQVPALLMGDSLAAACDQQITSDAAMRSAISAERA